jgi:glycosyltransferase involved in cell wall biosynthesis
MTRLAILASHPIQYYAPLFRALALRCDLTVFYAHEVTPEDQGRAGFGVGFTWDVDLLTGYKHVFLSNVATEPSLERFKGVDTPEIPQLLQQGQFDALLLMGWYLKCFIQGLVAAKRLGIPVMVRGDSHLDIPRSPLKLAIKRALYPHFLRRFDGALVVGKRNRAYWEHYGYPRGQMFDTPHCVDNAFFAKRATQEARADLRNRLIIPPDAKVVLFAGKLIPLKRPNDLIDAVTRLQSAGQLVHVIVAGSGPLEDELRTQSQACNVPTHFLGFCNQSQMPQIYAAADILVLCSESETWGLVVNEAIASGRPALVSDVVGCAPDLAELLGSGAVFRLGDIADFTQKLGNLLLSPPTPEQIAAAASYFDLGATADKIIAAAKALTTKRPEFDA